MGVTRRAAVIAGAGAVAGALAAGSGIMADEAYAAEQPLPFYGGYASLLKPDPTQFVARSGRVVWAAEVTVKALALTFDDGPQPNWTPRVLDALERVEVPATFFCKGGNVVRHSGIHRDSVGRHEIANHSYSHPDLARLDFDAVRTELTRCNDAILQAYGIRPTLFRPPYGHVAGATIAAAASLGLTTVAWSAQFREAQFASHPGGLVDDAVTMVRPGTILLGHDTGRTERLLAIDRLGAVIARLKDEGWTFHTVSELLAMESPESAR